MFLGILHNFRVEALLFEIQALRLNFLNITVVSLELKSSLAFRWKSGLFSGSLEVGLFFWFSASTNSLEVDKKGLKFRWKVKF